MKGQQVVEKLANKVGGRVYEEYSGRCMFGETCLGVVCDDADECLEEAAILGLRGGCVDQLGLRMIVYWPKVKPDTEIKQ